MNAYYAGGGGDEDERVLEWEDGLPTTDDLTPLSQSLIPPELASAFSITPESSRTMLDVQRASQTTMSSLRRQNPLPSSSASLKALNSFASAAAAPLNDLMVIEEDETAGAAGAGAAGFEPSSYRNSQSTAAMEDSESIAGGAENSVDDPSSRASKKARLVWTPQLHKRFVEVVAHLGIRNAVPKTIMQLMNVEGLTRENVASHLQKYRLYLKRMQGDSYDGPSSSDHLFSSAQSPPEMPPPVPMPVQYAAAPPQMISMPMMGMAVHGHGGGHMGMMPSGGGHHPYPVLSDRPRDWRRGNRYGSVVPYPRGVPNDK